MFATRHLLEEQEVARIAPYATFSKHSRGRQYPEEEPAYRTPFQRDRDRVIHSEAFRKLEYKTQVFVNDTGDYYRTRLTHTLEVAQIGRTVARALRLNEDLTEAICLAHDLGHPPFGHAGEWIIDQLMQDWGGFNHNLQSFRVVTELEKRYADWPGLNLTRDTLEGLAKHETEFDLSQAVDFDPATRGSLEAQVADMADELAYNAHDLDDGLQSGLLDVEQLRGLEMWEMLCERIGWSEKGLEEVERHRFIRELIGLQVDDLLSSSAVAIADSGVQSLNEVQQHEHNLVRYSEAGARRARTLKAFLYDKMYSHFRIVRMQERARHFIVRLFEAYIKEPRQLPARYAQRMDEVGVYRVVADYIASMTDRSALLEYRQLFDPMMRP